MGDDQYRLSDQGARTATLAASGGSAARPTAQGHYRGFPDRSESIRGMPGPQCRRVVRYRADPRVPTFRFVAANRTLTIERFYYLFDEELGFNSRRK